MIRRAAVRDSRSVVDLGFPQAKAGPVPRVAQARDAQPFRPVRQLPAEQQQVGWLQEPMAELAVCWVVQRGESASPCSPAPQASLQRAHPQVRELAPWERF